MRGQSPFRNRVAVGVLVALVAVLGLADFLPHTDDGCAVESHCVACRAHIGAVSDGAIASLVSTPVPAVTDLGRVPDRKAPIATASLLPAGRAPPAEA